MTASAGNHGLGVAYAAQVLGAKATIVVPENASAAKQAALERFDVELVRHGSSYHEAEVYALGPVGIRCPIHLCLQRSGRHIGPGHDRPRAVRPGAGSRHDRRPGRRGWAASGLALAASQRPGVEVCGVEAAASPAVSAAVEAGQVTVVDVRFTLADGLAGNIEPGSVTVPIITRYVSQLVHADEAMIRDGVRYLASEHGLLAEPSGAIGVGAMSNGLVESAGGTVVIVLTGRNVTPSLFSDLIAGRPGEPGDPGEP